MSAPASGGPATAGDAGSEPLVLTRLRRGGSLGSRVRVGIMWTAASRILLQVVTLGSQAVLARILLPSDYGLFTLTLVLNGLAMLFTDLGLSTAVVQSRRLTDRLLATAFWLNSLSGVVVTLVVLALAPVIGLVYGEPRVVGLVQVSSLAFALNISSVPAALLQRALRFKVAGTVDVISTVCGMAATVALAARGSGAMSLVFGLLVQTVAADVLLWAFVRWRPKGFVHRDDLAALWRFGGGLTGSNMLNFLSRNMDTVLLGKTVSAGEVGLYGRSYNLMMLPLAQVTTVLSKVLLPAFSEMQSDLLRVRRAWATTVRASLLFGIPTGIGMAVASPAFIEVLFGRRWLGMVPSLSLLAASVPPQLIGRNIGPLYQALGRTTLQFKQALWSTAVTLLAIVAGLPWGINGVALALLVKSWFALAIPLVPAMRLIEMPAGDLWRASRGCVAAGLLLGVAASTAGWSCSAQPAAVVLGAQVLAGGTAYAVGLWLFERDMTRSVLRRLRRQG